jgi:hypothetical protein
MKTGSWTAGVKQPKRRAFLAAFAECGQVKKAAEVAGVSREQHYDWKAQDAAYAAAFAIAQQRAGDVLEDLVVERAQAGGLGANRLLLAMLAALRPERFNRRRTEIVGSGGGAVAVEIRFVKSDLPDPDANGG